MKKIIVPILIIILNTGGWAQPLPVKSNHTVIIDTDGAIDDMRAISLMLAQPEISIKAILVSDGSLPPDEGYKKIRSLLSGFKRDSIPIACGENLPGINPPWRQFNRKIEWGPDIKDPGNCLRATDHLSSILADATDKITLICLGPLSNIGHLIKKDPALSAGIERIIWYTESANPLQGFNYECDETSAEIVLQSGMRLDIISNLKKTDALFDLPMYEVCRQSNTDLASLFYNVHSQPAVKEKLNQNHFRLCDELVVLYLTNPELFDINIMIQNVSVRYTKDYMVWGVREAIMDMLKGTFVSEHNVIFNRFPDQPEMFNYDVRPIMDTVIAMYGRDEWKANVMTDEFHGHLGVFSIVGAKMGIRARELFGVGPDMLRVISYAGSKPPYSCLNDGIQVSTGATLGMGTIHLAPDSIIQPSAIFTFNNRSIRLTLKQEYLEQIETDIQEGIVKFGLMDDGYWKLIRRNALKYWVEWNRNEIFEIEEVKITP